MRSISVSVAFWLLTYSGCAVSYETDVHYGLTYWLARKAGLDNQLAHEIARANERSDLGNISATHAILIEVCRGGGNIEDSSRGVRDRHFRSDVSVPEHPKKRPVEAAGKYAVQEVTERIEEHEKLDDAPYRFGRALHGFQDSYSHQGEASTLLACPDRWVWSHSQARGGPDSHKHDFTYEYPKDAKAMARRTYDVIVKFKKRRTSSNTTSAEPASLELDLNKFVGLKTKSEKEKWLIDQGVPQAREIAAKTNLDAGSKGALYFWGPPPLNLESKGVKTAAEQQEAQRFAIMLTTLRQFRKDRSAPEPVAQRFEEFVSAWLSGKPTLQDFLFQKLTLNGSSVESVTFVRVLNAMRSIDHGRVAATRHGLSEGGYEVQAPKMEWRQMLIGLKEQPFGVTRAAESGPSKGHYLSVVRLIQAPKDLLLFTIEEAGGKALVRDLSIVVID